MNIIKDHTLIAGVTVVDDEVFFVGFGQSKVTVYNSRSLTASRDISVTGMESPVGLAICTYNKALYVSDDELQCIHRVDLTNNFVASWKITKNRKPLGLSVTAEYTLLVTVEIRYNENRSGVVEYTSEGRLMRDISFDGSIVAAQHTVQLSSDQFIVSSGGGICQPRICKTSTDGQIMKSYVAEKIRSEDQLNEPYSMAIDIKSKHIFLGDYANHRVILLDCDLNYLGQVRTTYLLKYPYRIYFHSSTDRLFIVGANGFLMAITHPRLRNQ